MGSLCVRKLRGVVGGEPRLAPSLTEISRECTGSRSVLNALGFERGAWSIERVEDICGRSGGTGGRKLGVRCHTPSGEQRRQSVKRGITEVGGRMKEERRGGEMAWILWIFGFYAFWALLRRTSSLEFRRIEESDRHDASRRGGYDGRVEELVLHRNHLTSDFLQPDAEKTICEPIPRKVHTRPSHSRGCVCVSRVTE